MDTGRPVKEQDQSQDCSGFRFPICQSLAGMEFPTAPASLGCCKDYMNNVTYVKNSEHTKSAEGLADIIHPAQKRREPRLERQQ